jgi:intergrase/recombinase
MIEQGTPESVFDFIQGRASVTVGSAHYLAKTNQADLWYSKAIPKLIDICHINYYPLILIDNIRLNCINYINLYL